jgi:hypothetical protein
MEDLLTQEQWYGVLVVLIAQAGGFAVAWVTIRSSRASRRRDWLKNERRQAYANHLQSLTALRDTYNQATLEKHAARNLDPEPDREAESVQAVRVGEALDKYEYAKEQVLMVGSDDYRVLVSKFDPVLVRYFRRYAEGFNQASADLVVEAMTTDGQEIVHEMREVARKEFHE